MTTTRSGGIFTKLCDKSSIVDILTADVRRTTKKTKLEGGYTYLLCNKQHEGHNEGDYQ